MKFSVITIEDGNELEGTYLWEIVPASTIGSIIDDNGQLTAGNNNTDYTIEETVRVTDTTHDSVSATAIITIDVKKQLSAVGCELSISPSSASVLPGDTIAFSAKHFGKRCEEGSFEWKINSKIDSQTSVNGVYTAGKNESGTPAIDIVIVKDTTNNVNANAIVTVLSKEKTAQGVLYGRETYPKLLIVITVLIILIGTILLWRIKR